MMASLRHATLAFALGLAVFSSPSGSQAQTTAQTSAMAEALFRQGRDALKAEDYDTACNKFSESLKLESSPGTMLNLAICNDRRGKYATAWAQYGEAATMAKAEGRDKEEAYARREKEVVFGKLTNIVIEVTEKHAGLSVKLDGQPFSTGMFGSPLPVDAGFHTIEVSADGKKPFSMEVEAPEGPKTFTVTVPALEPAGSTLEPEAPPPVPGPAPPPSPSPTPDDDSKGDLTWLVATGFGIGGAGLLMGTIAGVVTLSRTGSIEDSCTSDTDCSNQQSEIDDATVIANVSNAGFVIGGIGVATGIIALIIDSGDDADPTSGLILGPGHIGYRGTF